MTLTATRNAETTDDPIAARLGLLGTDEACHWDFVVDELVFEYGYHRHDAEKAALEQAEDDLALRRKIYH